MSLLDIILYFNIMYLPGKISLRLTGGLLVSMVILKFAFLTGRTGLTTNLSGNLTIVCATLGAPGIIYEI